MIIYVFDARWPAGVGPASHGTKKVGRIYVSESSAITAVVTGIQQMADGNKESIELLRLCAHGNAGVLQLGQWPPGLNQSSAAQFSPLAGKFAAGNQGIEIHGCGVGSDTDIVKGVDKNNHAVCKPGTYKKDGIGYNFLKALATAAKVMVKGAVNCQLADAAFNYEGLVMSVSP